MTTPGITRQAEDIRRRLVALGTADEIDIYDLEYTAWEGSLARNWGGDGEYRELVQIGAVRLANRQGYPEITSFERLALPVFNPVLSDYFTKLTGITNTDLASCGEPFAGVIEGFAAFVGAAKIVAANGDDASCLSENCCWRGVVMPIAADHTLNLRPLVMAALGLLREQTVSSDLP